MREPLLLPLACLAAGIATASAVRFEAVEAWLALTAFAILTALASWKARTATRRAAAAGLFFAAGLALTVLHRPAPAPELDVEDGDLAILSGCVVQAPAFGRDRARFLLELGPGAIASVSMQEQAAKAGPPLAYGTPVELEAKVRRPHNYQNPGAFDFAAYLARRHIYWYASVPRDGAVRPLEGECGNRWAGAVSRLRSSALGRIERLYPGDDYAAGMLQAILLGESSKLERIWTDNFRQTGTYHALVISGLHVSVLAGLLLFLLRVCMAGEIPSLFVAACAAWVYAAVSGWSAPVIRAAGGFTLYLAARWAFRRGRVLNILAAIAIVFLCADPGQLFEASFLLSFLAVGALGAIAMPVLERTTGPLRRAPRLILETSYDLRVPAKAAALRVELRLLAETIALWTPIPESAALRGLAFVTRAVMWACDMFIVSAAIQFGLALSMILYFHRLSITGLVANLVVVPLMSAVVPIGFVALFSGSALAAGAAHWLIRVSEAVAAFHARFEPAWRVPDPPLWLAILFLASLVLLGWGLRRRAVLRWGTFGLAAGLFAAIVFAPFEPSTPSGQLELTAVDVGQGDALLVGFPNGTTMLVDGGGIPVYGKSAKPRIDTGEDVVSPYLWRRGFRRVDVVVSTHAHDDHCGGIPALLGNFHPRELWTGLNGAALAEAATRQGIAVRQPRAGDTIPFGPASVDILSPARDREAGGRPENDDSLVMRIRYGRTSFLLTGDIGPNVESEVASDPSFGKVDVLKIAHHGSKRSTIEPFLEAARPTFAVVSAGRGNTFGHPHPDIIERLAGMHTRLYRTDQDGLVTFRSDGRRVHVETWAESRHHHRWFLPGFGPE